MEIHQAATVVTDAGKETVVGGCEGEDTVAGMTEALDDSGDCGDDTAGVEDPVALYLPAMALALPPDDGIVEAFGYEGIAIDTMLGTADDGLAHAGRGFEIHVGDPKGQLIGGGFIPLHTIGVATGDGGIEIVSQRVKG